MSSIFRIKQNDTYPSLVANLKYANGTIIGLTGVSAVRLHLSYQSNLTPKVNVAAAILSAANGTVQYNWTPVDTDTVGRFYGEFEVSYNTGDIQTIPTEGYFFVDVINDLI